MTEKEKTEKEQYKKIILDNKSKMLDILWKNATGNKNIRDIKLNYMWYELLEIIDKYKIEKPLLEKIKGKYIVVDEERIAVLEQIVRKIPTNVFLELLQSTFAYSRRIIGEYS